MAMAKIELNPKALSNSGPRSYKFGIPIELSTICNAFENKIEGNLYDGNQFPLNPVPFAMALGIGPWDR
jgi:hypothetical protein